MAAVGTVHVVAGMTVVATVRVAIARHVMAAVRVVAVVHVMTAVPVVTAVHVMPAVRVVTAVSAVVPLVTAIFTVVIHMTVVAFVRSGLMAFMRGRVVVVTMVAVVAVVAVLFVLAVVAVLVVAVLPVLAAVRVRVVLLVRLLGRFSAPKLGQPAIESLGDLSGVPDRHAGLGRRDGVPQIRRPVAPRVAVALLGVVTAQDHEQIRLRRGTHTRPPSAYEFRLDGEPLASGSGGHRQQNSRPGNGRPQEPAPQLHRKAPSRQA
ncbi:hypothetical protein [Streptomyces cavernae]|uniref:hypothetical protein n=1 Tax=Streptomyces cavernae TaxID=2259034 RepID=UPI000FEC1116|nr:hypothetical protein [Streptomyces cavernae]